MWWGGFFFFFFLCRFLSFIGGTLYEIGKPEMQQKINSFLEKEGMEKTAERLQTTVHTLQVIVDGLSQPESFDFRTGKRWMWIPFTWVAHSDPAPQDPRSAFLSMRKLERRNLPSKSLKLVSIQSRSWGQVSRLFLPGLFPITLD